MQECTLKQTQQLLGQYSYQFPYLNCFEKIVAETHSFSRQQEKTLTFSLITYYDPRTAFFVNNLNSTG